MFAGNNITTKSINTNIAYNISENGTSPVFSASGLVWGNASKPLPSNTTAFLAGCFVSSASGTPTISFVNGTTSGGTVYISTFTPVAGTSYNFFNLRFPNGIYIVISGTVEVTVFFSPCEPTITEQNAGVNRFPS